MDEKLQKADQEDQPQPEVSPDVEPEFGSTEDSVPIDPDEAEPVYLQDIAIEVIAGKRVLLVEDDEESAQTIRGYLEGMDVHDVNVVNNADAAYALLTESRDNFPNIILLELALPGTDGIQFLAKLRAYRSEKVKTLPVVVVTQLDSLSVYHRTVRQKIAAFLKKPISEESLRQGMEDAFNGVIIEEAYVPPKSWLDDVEEKELRAKKKQTAKGNKPVKARKQGFLERVMSALIPGSDKT